MAGRPAELTAALRSQPICLLRRRARALERRPLPDRRPATTRGDHIAYADGLVPGVNLPHRTHDAAGEYYTPPGYYALAGVAVWVAQADRLAATPTAPARR